MNQDIAELKRNTDIVAVISRYLPLKKEGPHFVCSCPFHSERTSSFKITPNKRQMYKCFGCGKSGDVIDFLIEYAGRSFKEAIAELKDPNNTAAIAPGAAREYNKPAEWTAVEPRSPFIQPTIEHWKHGKPHRTWIYRNANGHPLSFVCRFDLPGGKEVIPFSYCRNIDGREEWRFKGLEKPRPLYNLHQITMRQEEPILIGEGEKTADAMHSLFIHHTCTTWIGGVDGVRHTDFTVLAGRDVVLWPDNDKDKTYKSGPRKGEVMDFHDQPGNKAMLHIAKLLLEMQPPAKSVMWVRNAEEFPCGWDVADSIWTPFEAQSYLEANLIPVPEPKVSQEPTAELRGSTPAPVAKDTPVMPDSAKVIELPPSNDLPAPPPIDPDGKDPGLKHGSYFRFLGYEKDVTVNLYHFYSYQSKSVITLSPSAMTRPNLLQLGPLKWWEDYFPGRRGNFELDSAQNWLISRSIPAGVFSSKWIRGRGAWMDGKDVVIHTGSELIVNGKPMDFKDYNSRYIYEIGDDMGFKPVEPLSSKESRFLIELMKLLNFERDADAYLLAGWCVIAPMCGALKWRPHIWLTGPSGSGKSWVFEKIVRALLGESALAVQGETSEAGLRQVLKHDALPVVFDEAEGEDKKSQDRMADVLSLMRSASHSDGGFMAKGSSGGTAKTYRMRSCFAFASIAIQVQHQSDRTRVTIVSLRKPANNKETKERWADLQKKYYGKIDEDYSARLRSRTIANLPVILKNAETFASAAAAELGQQRTGDQIGILLAGAWSLHSHKEVTYKQALAWIQEKNWSEERSHEQTRDELSLVQHLLGQTTRVESTASGIQERTIGELVRIAAGILADIVFDPKQANDRLSRLGMKVQSVYLIIGNNQSVINGYLSGTHWAKNYNKILLRLDGATSMDKTTFASGVNSRATKIPLSTLFGSEPLPLMPEGMGIITNADSDLPF